MASVLIMAGGTGGHVYPGLAVAQVLRRQGMDVVWMGTRHGLEATLVPPSGIPIEWISIRGLRGNGLLGWIALPFRMAIAMTQALSVFFRRRPSVVLSMGGYVAGPGGLVAWLLRKPLVIHEANAVPGFTNRWLSLVASRVLCGFPGTFGVRSKVKHVGNPVREDIAHLESPGTRLQKHTTPMRLLMLGGSQGARALNTVMVDAWHQMSPEDRPDLWHQTGARWQKDVQAAYGDAGNLVRVDAFIDNMAEAYAWADIVLCRAGAMTIAELAAVGVGSILVPLPTATDDHQTANANYLADRDAAVVIAEADFTPEKLRQLVGELKNNRHTLVNMAENARASSVPDADVAVAQICEELARA
ncbi:MAG: undecaprenyldiphospho-muramoylpentapeptide beta-N-acetylglucosaminyltransferase [Acidiferrobacterales bacterium]